MRTDADDIPANHSGNRPFHDVVATRFSRRGFLAGGLATAATGFFLGACSDDDDDASSPSTTEAATDATTTTEAAASGELVGFEPIALGGTANDIEVAAGYTAVPLAVFGDPLVPSGPAYTDVNRSAADVEAQIGAGHDGMMYAPVDGNERGALIFNNEYATDPMVLPAVADNTEVEAVRKSQFAHGVTVVEVAKEASGWAVVESDLARNIHTNTPVTFAGPAAADPALATGADPLGTLGNCGSGETLWGTFLTAEENFDGFFGVAEGTEYTPDPIEARLGVAGESFYGWYAADPRFDLIATPNEIKRFGWIVEIDPLDATSVPVKRTALGRFKHEAAAMVETDDGRVAVYMGDDQRDDYIYKFVSAQPWQDAIDAGQSPLDDGILYVARFDDDGSGEWLELSPENPALSSLSLAEILIGARNAADIVGATPMDRPEWAAVAPDGSVYINLTNNSAREEANGPNPRVANEGGQILRLEDGDHASTDITWDLFVIAWDPTQPDGATDDLDAETAFSSPDGLYIDPDGRIFVQTDGDQLDEANNQMVVIDPETGAVKRLFNGPGGCEVTGFAHTPDRTTMFVNIQHPGDNDADMSISTWPGGADIPRAAVVAITKDDGGIIGS